MCGRFILAQKIEVLEKRFNIEVPKDFSYKPCYNISPGDYTLVITNEHPKKFQLFRFGLAPFWAKKDMYLIILFIMYPPFILHFKHQNKTKSLTENL